MGPISFTAPTVGSPGEPIESVGTPNSDGSFRPDFGAGNGGSDDFNFDPIRHISRDKRNADGSFRRKRAKRGTSSSGGGGRRTPKGSSVSSIDAIAQSLMIIAAGVAGVTKCPEYNLDDDDAQTLGKATANFCDQFEITPDPKVQASIALVTAIAIVFGPKIMMVRLRQKDEKEAKKNQGPFDPSKVTQFNPGYAS